MKHSFLVVRIESVKMVIMIRFSNIVTLLIVLFFYFLRSSIAQPYQDVREMAFVVDNKMPRDSSGVVRQEQRWNDIQAMIEERLAKLGGRKMIMKRFLEQKTVTEESPNGDSLRVSESSTAAPCVGGEIASRSKVSVHAAKVPIEGVYIPLDEDYHIPRPHPPKNN